MGLCDKVAFNFSQLCSLWQHGQLDANRVLQFGSTSPSCRSGLFNIYQHITVLGISEVLLPCLIGPSPSCLETVLVFLWGWLCKGVPTYRPPLIPKFLINMSQGSWLHCKTWLKKFYPYVFFLTKFLTNLGLYVRKWWLIWMIKIEQVKLGFSRNWLCQSVLVGMCLIFGVFAWL